MHIEYCLSIGVLSIVALSISRNRRLAQYTCICCRYDCSASCLPVCPECGHSIAKSAQGQMSRTSLAMQATALLLIGATAISTCLGPQRANRLAGWIPTAWLSTSMSIAPELAWAEFERRIIESPRLVADSALCRSMIGAVSERHWQSSSRIPERAAIVCVDVLVLTEADWAVDFVSQTVRAANDRTMCSITSKMFAESTRHRLQLSSQDIAQLLCVYTSSNSIFKNALGLSIESSDMNPCVNAGWYLYILKSSQGMPNLFEHLVALRLKKEKCRSLQLLTEQDRLIIEKKFPYLFESTGEHNVQ